MIMVASSGNRVRSEESHRAHKTVTTAVDRFEHSAKLPRH